MIVKGMGRLHWHRQAMVRTVIIGHSHNAIWNRNSHISQSEPYTWYAVIGWACRCYSKITHFEQLGGACVVMNQLNNGKYSACAAFVTQGNET